MLKIFNLENANEFIEKEVNESTVNLKVVTALIYKDWLLVFYENDSLLDKRFIAKEELRKKLSEKERLINNIITSNQIGIQSKELDRNVGIYLGYKEILKLLEE